MLVYIMGILATIGIGWIGIHTRSYRRGRKTWTVLFTILPLFLIAALRYDVGTDYLYVYVPYFQTLSWGRELREIEPLFRLLNQMIIWMGGHYQWVFVVCAGIFTLLVFSQIFRDSPAPLLSIFLLYGLTYYFISLNATRQMVACAILLYSLRYVEAKQWKKFAVTVVIASGFHYSCVLFAVVYVIGRWKIRPRDTVGLSALLFLCTEPITAIALEVIRMTPYRFYIGSQFDTDQSGRIILAIQVVVLILAAWQYRDVEKYRIYFNLHMINTWLASFAGRIVLIERIRWIFGLSSVILIPMAIRNISNTKMRFLVRVSVIVCFAAYACIVIGIRGNHEVLPYRSILGLF